MKSKFCLEKKICEKAYHIQEWPQDFSSDTVPFNLSKPSLPSSVLKNAKNRSLVAIIPFPFVHSLNDARTFVISSITHLTYTLVSGLFIFDLGRFDEFMGPLLIDNILVTSRQSRYIMYGSSNFTLKKNEEPDLYGDDDDDRSLGVTCWVRTTNPSTGSPFHSPFSAHVFVKSCTCWIVSKVIVGVLMKPHSSAKASTMSVGSVLNSLERMLRPCRWRPVFRVGILERVLRKNHHITIAQLKGAISWKKRKRLTSAMAVKLESQSLLDKSSSVFPFFVKYFFNHASPAWAWLTSFPTTGPRECLEVMINLVDVKAAMKMIHPFDFNERVYGATVCVWSESH